MARSLHFSRFPRHGAQGPRPPPPPTPPPHTPPAPSPPLPPPRPPPHHSHAIRDGTGVSSGRPRGSECRRPLGLDRPKETKEPRLLVRSRDAVARGDPHARRQVRPLRGAGERLVRPDDEGDGRRLEMR